MSNAYFEIRPVRGENEHDVQYYEVFYNCNGKLGFMASQKISGEEARLLELAIDEGKRRKVREIRAALGDDHV